MGSLNKYLTVVVICFSSVVDGKECLKNMNIGRREHNIYTCDDPGYPVCCEREQEFTCCEERLSKTLREQLQLWGTVAVFILLLYIVYMYFTGGSCCSLPSIDSCRWCCDWAILRHNKHDLNSNKYMRENTETQQILQTDVKTMGHDNLACTKSPYNFSRTNSLETFRIA